MVRKQLNDNDRFYIEKRLVEGDSFNQIAQILACVHSTISRERKSHIPNNFQGVCYHRFALKQDKGTRSNSTPRHNYCGGYSQ
ncbi:helix-turn-helix domain-containing protein [Candidatus Enterovibrio escicola]|uniref:Transposase IS30-like HTH domain-containing protein n=1 Tax=Candidatus Enterovibrio escicola TaxID=1927127 RepID=A0A2A5T5W5_9GAMM|nr:helix-turn-helix domain-containing protein [Candidatus Enterovibrio escacola]PCS23565.1 hypothetical protein BTN49_0534 [Candidatus Enterovibrio escacola]